MESSRMLFLMILIAGFGGGGYLMVKKNAEKELALVCSTALKLNAPLQPGERDQERTLRLFNELDVHVWDPRIRQIVATLQKSEPKLFPAIVTTSGKGLTGSFWDCRPSAP
jgi:hypothetical protein